MQLRDEMIDFLRASPRPLLVFVGPTASGKTAASIACANWLKGEGRSVEIVNADSRQLYRFLDIGTAKPTPSEMGDVPHHLFSVLDPREEVSIAWYQEAASGTIDSIIARGHVPILVGGSMLYVSAIVDDLQPLPKSDGALRSRLEQEYDMDMGANLLRKLQAIDPESARTIPVQNRRYLVRAMEVVTLTGKPKSAQLKSASRRYDVFMIGMGVPREVLKGSIERRTRTLLHAGWIDEVRSLIARGYGSDDPAMQSTGYRQIIRFVKEGGDRQELVDEIIRQTKRYAKRQMTWWRGDERIHWVRSTIRI